MDDHNPNPEPEVDWIKRCLAALERPSANAAQQLEDMREVLISMLRRQLEVYQVHGLD